MQTLGRRRRGRLPVVAGHASHGGTFGVRVGRYVLDMTPRAAFLWIARLEGLSLLVLVGLAVPLKYIWGMGQATIVPGWIHGALFVAYVGALAFVGSREGWTLARMTLAFVAAWLPFGTLVFERWLGGLEPGRS